MINLVNYSDDENSSDSQESVQVKSSQSKSKIERMQPSIKSKPLVKDETKTDLLDDDSPIDKNDEESLNNNYNIDLNSLTEEDKIKFERRKVLQPFPYPDSGLWTLPPAPKKPVDEEIKRKIDHFFQLKEQGVLFNDNIMKMKSFRNPNIYHKLVDYLELQEVGTNFKHQNQFPKQGYYDQIARWQNDLEEERVNRNRQSNVQMNRSSTFLKDRFQSSASTSSSNNHQNKRRRWDVKRY